MLDFLSLFLFLFWDEGGKYSTNLTSGHVPFSEQLSAVFHFLFSFVLSFSLFLGTSHLWMGWRRRRRRSCSSSFHSSRTCWWVTMAAFSLSQLPAFVEPWRSSIAVYFLRLQSYLIATFFFSPLFFPRFTLPVSLLRTEWVNWPLFQSHGRKLWWLTGTDIIFLFYFFPLWPLRNSKCKKKCCFFIRILNKANIKKNSVINCCEKTETIFVINISIFFSCPHSVLRKKLQACFYKSCWNTLNRGRSKIFSTIIFFLALYQYRFR